jgi:cell wall-associated NlpC family hydrolase
VRNASVLLRLAVGAVIAVVASMLLGAAAPVQASHGRTLPAQHAHTALDSLDAYKEVLESGLDATQDLPEVASKLGALNSALRATAAATVSTPDLLLDEWRNAGLERTRVVLTALAEDGVEYEYATAKPGVSFDCSGLTRYAWATAGTEIGQSSAHQAQLAEKSLADATPGDVLWYPGHVMLFVGSGKMIHAGSEKIGVVLGDVGRVDRVVDPMPLHPQRRYLRLPADIVPFPQAL